MITERVSFEAQVVFTNIFNHVKFKDPGPGDYPRYQQSGGLGHIAGANRRPYYPPRQMEFGFRVSF